MSGVIAFVSNHDRRGVNGNYVGIGRNESQAKSDLYDTLYSVYDRDGKVHGSSLDIRIIKEVPESVLFYASFCYNDEVMKEKRVDNLEDKHKDTDLSDLWGPDWRERLQKKLSLVESRQNQ